MIAEFTIDIDDAFNSLNYMEQAVSAAKVTFEEYIRRRNRK